MFKKNFQQILMALGLVSKAKAGSLTEEEWNLIDAEFQKQYGKSMNALMLEASKQEELNKDRAAALGLLSEVTDVDGDEESADGDADNDGEGADAPDPSNDSLELKVASMLNKLDKSNALIKEQQSKIDKMAAAALPDNPMKVVSRKISAMGGAHTESHLFGIEHSMFSISNRWNKIAANPNVAKLTDATRDEQRAFESEVRKYGGSLAQRYRHLQETKQLNLLKGSTTFTNDTSDLSGAGLGDQYVQLRQDALIARILEIPTVYDFFPRRYGVQDRELMTIAYFEELSQAYQPGHVFKGGMKLQPELGYVDDAMFKAEFGPMKEIERQYIGYLNTDGSDPMKWSMIEWQLLNMYKVLVNEQNTRVIRGCYVKPETGVAGSYLNAGTGLLYTLQRYYHENKLLPFSDVVYNSYSESTMLAAVNAFLTDVIDVLDEDESLDNKFIYLNKRHQSWWIKNIRSQFGKDTDFTGPDSYKHVVPDFGVRIKWLPNLGSQNKLMFIQEHGNFQALEFVPGEMLAVDFDKAMELMHVWSTWKEGFSAFIVGKPFNTLAELKANNYSMQTVFMNKPATVLAADATTADASSNYWFVTGVNTQAKAITDITNAKAGVVYIIEVGDATTPQTIAKADKFSTITKAWEPTIEGDYIMVALNSEGKFIELERRSAGVRAINTAAQPNIIGGRK